MSGNPASYTLSIDWSDAGGFPDNGDIPFLRSFRIKRGRDRTLVGDASSGEAKLARNEVGTMTLTLDNFTRRYDAYNTASALYPHITPGKVVRLRVTDDLSNTYTLFTGIVDDIKALGYGDDPLVQISCSDAWKQLSQRPIPTSFYSGYTIYPVLIEILGYAGIALGVTHLGSDWFYAIWGGDDVPHRVIHDLIEMDGGYCWIDVANQFNNLSRVVALAQTPTVTLDQSECLKDIQLSQPWENICNEVHVGLYDRTHPDSIVSCWDAAGTPSLAPGASLSFLMKFTGPTTRQPCPMGVTLGGGQNQVVAVNFNSQADGSGTPLALGITQIFPPSSPGGPNGLGLGGVEYLLKFQNLSSQTGYLVSLSLMGNPYEALNPTEIVVSDPTSIADHGTRVLRLDYQYMSGANVANTVAQAYLARLKDPRVLLGVKIVNRSTKQFANDLNTLLNFTSSYLSPSSLRSTVKAGAAADGSTALPPTGAFDFRIWNGPTDALTQNGVGAYSFVGSWAVGDSPIDSYFLIITGFGFSLIPTDEVIGIAVRIRKRATVEIPMPVYSAGVIDGSVKLVIGGTPSGDDKKDATTLWGTSFANSFYGGPADKWGLTPTYSQINASNFGIAVSARALRGSYATLQATPHIDFVEVTVYTNNGAFPHAFRLIGIEHKSGTSLYEVESKLTLEPTANSSGLLSPDQVISEPGAGEQMPMVGGITY